jgi:hypothetical protein
MKDAIENDCGRIVTNAEGANELKGARRHRFRVSAHMMKHWPHT